MVGDSIEQCVLNIVNIEVYLVNNLYEYINVDSSLEANIDIWLMLA